MKILILILIILISIHFTNYLNYWKMIWFNSKKPNQLKWKLCDKIEAKKYAEENGFLVPKLYQFKEFPNQLIEPKVNSYVVKPTDLCDSEGVYLIRNGINLGNNKKISFSEIQKELVKLRCGVGLEYYMHNDMYQNRIPNNGYIIEELLLNNGKLPTDYKCYVFQGKIYFIANTYNRKVFNGEQKFNSVWFTRNWKPIPIKMIKKGYKYQKLPKPEGLDNMIEIVEKVGKKLNRHCRIDVYLINGKTYFGEFTFFGGAFLHTRFCNNILGLLWKIYPDKI